MGLEVAVVKAVRVPVGSGSVRGWLAAAAAVPEVARRVRRLAGRGSSPALAVRLTGDRELRRLNRQFLAEDRSTDVLSFPLGGREGYLGDIAVSWPAVVRQAAEYGHPVEVELAVLCVHGFLHLLGWDHASARQEAAMWEVTHRCLEAAGVGGLAEGRLDRR